MKFVSRVFPPTRKAFMRAVFSLSLLAPWCSTGNMSAQTLTYLGTASPVDFGSANVCAAGKTTPAPCSTSFTLKYQVTSSGTLKTPSVTTEGTPNLDFTLAGGSTCTGAVTAGATCTVNVTFAPRYGGNRRGGVRLSGASGDTLVQTFLLGNGLIGPRAAFYPAVQSAYNPTLRSPTLLAADAAGDLFVSDYQSSGRYYQQLQELPSGGGTPKTLLVVDAQSEIGQIVSAALDGAGNIFVGAEAYPSPKVLELPAAGGKPVVLPFGSLTQAGWVAVDGAGDVFCGGSGEFGGGELYEWVPGATVATALPFSIGDSTITGLYADPVGNLYFPESKGLTSQVIERTSNGDFLALPLKSNLNPLPMFLDGQENLYAQVFATATSASSRILELPKGQKNPITIANIPNPPFYFLEAHQFVVDPAGDVYLGPILNDKASTIQKVSRSQAAPLIFPDTYLGGKATLPLNINNAGSGTLALDADLAGPNFILLSTQSQDCLAGITAEQTCRLRVSFAPEKDGPLASTLTLESAMGTRSVVALHGTGSGIKPPLFSLPSGVYGSPQSVTISDASSGSTIYYTTDGSRPTASSIPYTGAVTLDTTQRLTAIAISGDQRSAPNSAAYTTVSVPAPSLINFSHGFAQAAGPIQFNGAADLDDASLQLSNGGIAESSSAFYTTAVNVQSFTTYFTFQITHANADGFTFALQNAAATALGIPGQGLGYQGIANSVGIKFDLHDNAGEGVNSTGVYTEGSSPAVPSVSLADTGIDLHSEDPLLAQITYNGTALALTLTDTVTLATWSHSFLIDIPTAVGGNTALVGFTASTGQETSDQRIFSWTYAAGTPAALPPPPVPAVPPVPDYADGFAGASMTTNGTATVTGHTLHLTSGQFHKAGSAYYPVPLDIRSFTTDFAFALRPSKTTIADGITLTFQNSGPAALGGVGGDLGYAGISKSVAIKFDVHNNDGEGVSSTGIYLDGAKPTIPAINTYDAAGGVQLTNYFENYYAHLTYDGANLTLTLTDGYAPDTFRQTFPVDIPAVVGGDTALVGFTGATGGLTSLQQILNWTFTNP